MMMSQKRPPASSSSNNGDSFLGPKLLFARNCRRRKDDDDDDDNDKQQPPQWQRSTATAGWSFTTRCTHCRQPGHDLVSCQCFAMARSSSGKTSDDDINSSGGTNLCADCDDVADDMMLYCDACEGRLCSRGSCDYRTCHGCSDVTFCRACIVTTMAGVVTSCPNCSAMYCGDCSLSAATATGGGDDNGGGHNSSHTYEQGIDSSSSTSSNNSEPLSFLTTCVTCNKTACTACYVNFAPPCDGCGAAVCQDCVVVVPPAICDPRVVADGSRRCRRSCPSCAAAAAAATAGHFANNSSVMATTERVANDSSTQSITMILRTPNRTSSTSDHEAERF